jgi:hypothetical protein
LGCDVDHVYGLVKERELRKANGDGPMRIVRRSVINFRKRRQWRPAGRRNRRRAQ